MINLEYDYRLLRTACVFLVGVLSISVSQSNSVVAQVESRTVTVLERPRPEYDPLGWRISGFTLNSAVEVSEEFNDNIFATKSGTTDDFITTISPSAQIESNWSQHLVAISGKADIARYLSNSNEDHEKYNLAATGRLDIRRNTNLSTKLEFEKGSEDRSSVDDANGKAPTEFDIISLHSGLFNKWNRVSIEVDGELRRHDYDDVETTTGSVNNDDRDRDETRFGFRMGYEVQREYEAFFNIVGTSIDYVDSLDDRGLNRDNSGYEVRAGARVDITGLLFGDLYVGYLDRDYDSQSLKSVEEITGGIDLTWNVTPLSTVKLGVRRDIGETTLASASANLSTQMIVSVDHELLRNLIVSAEVRGEKSEFEGSAREDDNIGAGLSAKYLLNRNFSLSLGYSYAGRNSSVESADYDINKIMFRIRAQL